MATVTGLTAGRMLQIESNAVISGQVDNAGRLILTTHGGDEIDAGSVVIGTVSHIHNQASPSAIWHVTHTLAFMPSVTVVDSAGTWFIGAVTFIDATHIDITFTAPFSGTAYLS